MRFPQFAAITCAALAVGEVVTSVITHSWVPVGAAVGCAGMAIAITTAERKRNANRHPGGDSHDPSASPVGGSYTISNLSTTTSFGAGPWYTGLPSGWTPEAGEGSELKRSTAEVPILGFKVAQIVIRSGVWMFSGFGGPYEPEDPAECRAMHMTSFGTSHDHPAPFLPCSCGYYSLREPVDEPARGDDVLLDVELFGKVIVYSLGYRAERQRAVMVTLANWCEMCGEPATAAVIPKGFLPDHATRPVTVRCRDHIHGDDVTVKLDTIARGLGCPVRFEDGEVHAP